MRSDTPSQLLQAFVYYLRARPTLIDQEGARFDEGSFRLEAITRVA